MYASGKNSNRSKKGKREDLNHLFVRSSWEANYARYLNYLIATKQIKSWSYEPETFEFKSIKKGTRFYTPDFRIVNYDGTIEYHEVKGWMRPKAKTQIKRFKKYYPHLKFVLIDSKLYKELVKSYAKTIPNWEK